MTAPRYDYLQNDPFDFDAPIRLVVERAMPSADYMATIRDFAVPADGLAVWFLGQNGFVLRSGSGPLVGIDPYLSDSCVRIHGKNVPFHVDRQLPVFIEPEDFAVDVLLLTHSHTDHADPETLARYGAKASTTFVAPWEAQRVLASVGVPAERCHTIHAKQRLDFDGFGVTGAFALPTDATDLNHLGYYLSFANGLTFFNSGDSAYCERLAVLHGDIGPIDVASICINGGFHNLTQEQAAHITRALAPQVVVPCHYDMMVNNVGDPRLFRAALARQGIDVPMRQLRYYEPWVYRRS